jgi:DNA-binding LytR/AlgR family response regulator
MAPNEFVRKGFKRNDQLRAFPLGLAKVPALDRDCILLIDVEDIFYISGAGDYTAVHTSEKDLLCRLTLNELEKRLQDRLFFRVHRSFIANLNKCESIYLGRDGRYLQLSDRARTKIPISRGKAKMLRDFVGF